MSKTTKILLGVGAGIFFAVSIALVIYGVVTHKEEGLLTVCWENTQANYSGDCTPVKWDKALVPLTYYIDFDNDHKKYTESVVKAAGMWNTEIGTVFKRVEDRKDAVVLIDWGSYRGGMDCIAGWTSHRGTSTAYSAHVQLKEPSTLFNVFQDAAHELGHVLGLAHDTFKSSVMYPYHREDDNVHAVLPSDSDKKLLKELYSQGKTGAGS